MLPLLILVVPPSLAGGGYACWYLGKNTALTLFQSSKRTSLTSASSSSEQSTQSYMAGMTTLVVVYGLQSSQFHRLVKDTSKSRTQAKIRESGVKNRGNSTAYVPPHKQPRSQQFQPPKSMNDAFRRMGRPVLMRAGAGGIALFCSGIFQTFVVIRSAGD
mmetsp:Transcript_7676/g.7234  ORF Transcript_7676/g.7234 Transcript_7676/m.7234 type:complete len:160 (-) Transcript_7676:123-602(-)